MPLRAALSLPMWSFCSLPLCLDVCGTAHRPRPRCLFRARSSLVPSHFATSPLALPHPLSLCSVPVPSHFTPSLSPLASPHPPSCHSCPLVPFQPPHPVSSCHLSLSPSPLTSLHPRPLLLHPVPSHFAQSPLTSFLSPRPLSASPPCLLTSPIPVPVSSHFIGHIYQ